MKTTINEKQEKPFPKLMEGKYQIGELIVLFTDKFTGKVVKSDFYPLGMSGKYWNPINFKDFHGTITLEND
jgi:hypothetical protein